MVHWRLPYGLTAVSVLVVAALVALSCERKAPANQPLVVAVDSPRGDVTSADFVDLVERVRGSVVNITSKRVVAVRRTPFEEFFGPFFGRRPDDLDEQRRVQRALGSGFIIDEEGHVVTNFHVIEGAEDISIKLFDGRQYDADIVGRDDKTDLALLKLRDAGDDLPIATLGRSSEVKVGELVLAIGNPFGLGHTVTHGIVSATERVIGAGPYDNFVQTDASINPGNSGGPLFDMKGRVIGVNAMIEATGRGIGFAIPVDDVREIVPQLRATGRVERGRIGVVFQPMTPEIAMAIGLSETKGAMVVDVEPDGPADQAGIRPGDVLLKVEDETIESPEQLARAIAGRKPFTEVSLTIFRNGEEQTLTATLGRVEPQGSTARVKPPKRKPMGGGPPPNAPALGVSVEDARGGGARIVSIQPGGPADGVLMRGDVIVEMNGAPVGDARELRRLARRPKGPAVLLRVRRNGEERYVGLPLGR